MPPDNLTSRPSGLCRARGTGNGSAPSGANPFRPSGLCRSVPSPDAEPAGLRSVLERPGVLRVVCGSLAEVCGRPERPGASRSVLERSSIPQYRDIYIALYSNYADLYGKTRVKRTTERAALCVYAVFLRISSKSADFTRVLPCKMTFTINCIFSRVLPVKSQHGSQNRPQNGSQIAPESP